MFEPRGHHTGVLLSALCLSPLLLIGIQAPAARSLGAQEPSPETGVFQESGASQDAGAYGYVRVVDGSATLVQAGSGERVRVQTNEPLLVGDELFVSNGARLELYLADRNIVRLDGGTDLGFDALAYSPDRNDRQTVIALRRGRLQFVVSSDYLGQAFPRVVTPNASIELRGRGSYLIEVRKDNRTELVVREGGADVSTEGERADVRAGEELVIEGRYGSELRFVRARALDRLEQWGAALASGGGGEYRQYVDKDLYYSAASLKGYGSWISVGAGFGWRPRVSIGWSPFFKGRWRYTPSGLFWVSYEPWGWVPYHYGGWDYITGYGWLWFPGRRFSPGHVYWYWGPNYAGWVPAGYYTRYYRQRYGRGFDLHVGLYGHVGGSFSPFHRWVFTPLREVGRHRQDRYAVTGYDLGSKRTRLGRGLLTNDTRGFTPDTWRSPADILRVAKARESRSLGRGRVDLDATAFVERRRSLPREVERVAIRPAGQERVRSRGAIRVAQPGERDLSREARAPSDRRVTREPTRSRPDVRRPEVQARDRSRPDVRRPGVQRPDARRPEVRRPEVRRPEVQRPDARRPEVQRPDARRPGVQRPDARRPGVQRPDARRPEVQRPDARRPEVQRPDARRPEVRRPDARRPEVQRPDARRPEVRRPDARRPEVQRPDARRPEVQNRPQVRAPTRNRPQVRRPSASRRPPSRRPEVRSSPSRRGGYSRPTARPAPTRQAPTSRRAPSRPQVRSPGRAPTRSPVRAPTRRGRT